jgi:protein TonB
VLFGSITLAGFGRHKARLPEGTPEHAITLTLVAAPDVPAVEQPNVAVQSLPPVTSLAPPAEPLDPVKPPEPKTPVPAPVRNAEPKPVPILPVAVPIQKETIRNPPVIQSGPPSTPPAVTLNPPLPDPVRGDGSSLRPGDDSTTQQAPLGVRARPDYRRNPEPPYPLAARRRRQEGVVILGVKVSSQGRALRVEVKQSAGVAILDEAALEAVRGWEFEPARIGIKPVDSEIEVPVRFKLQP